MAMGTREQNRARNSPSSLAPGRDPPTVDLIADNDEYSGHVRNMMTDEYDGLV
jgi:hypothetical protein